MPVVASRAHRHSHVSLPGYAAHAGTPKPSREVNIRLEALQSSTQLARRILRFPHDDRRRQATSQLALPCRLVFAAAGLKCDTEHIARHSVRAIATHRFPEGVHRALDIAAEPRRVSGVEEVVGVVCVIEAVRK